MYKELARVYDRLMADVPMDAWVSHIDQLLATTFEEGPLPGRRLLDLGCGTGSISLLLAKMGYQVTGLDLSGPMLEVARKKFREEGLEGKFLEQDMGKMEFQNSFDMAIATFDTFNYLLEEKELAQVLERVYRALATPGILVFDMNTHNKFTRILGQEDYTYNTEDLVYIWENEYDPKERLARMDLTFFLKEEGDRYRRFVEHHQQRYYPVKTMRRLLSRAGFQDIHCYRDLSFASADGRGERNFFITVKI